MLWSPLRVGIAGILAWGLIWLISPLTVINPIDSGSMFFVLICYLGFFAGCLLAERVFPKWVGQHHTWSGEINYRAAALTGFIGLVGMGARYYDRSFLRGVDYSQNSDQVREALLNASASIWGIFGSVLFPFCFLPLIYILAARWQRKNVIPVALASLIFSLPMIESLAQLSRSIMLMTAVMFFVAVGCLKMAGRPQDRRLLFPAIVSAIALVVASSLILSARLVDSGRDLRDSVVESVYAANIAPTDEALKGMLRGSPLEAQFYATVLPNSMYYLSGGYEFSLLWTRPDEQPFTYGGYMFSPIVKALNIVFKSDDSEKLDEEEIVYRIGVFNSFFGPVWIDFGWLGSLFCGLFGFVTTRLAQSARSGNLAIIPLYFYSVVIIFYMPVVNFISTGYGVFAIISFGIFAFLANRRGAVGSFADERLVKI